MADFTLSEPGAKPVSEQLARLFHETYERLAPTFGYQTRKESAVPWEQVPAHNKALMVAVADEVEHHIIPPDVRAAIEAILVTATMSPRNTFAALSAGLEYDPAIETVRTWLDELAHGLSKQPEIGH
jgi:hypothetical protein